MFWIPDVIPFAHLAELMPALVFVMVLRLYHAVEAREPGARGATTGPGR